MYPEWISHLKTNGDKQNYIESIKRVRWVLDDLKNIYDGRINSLDRNETSTKQFDNPNWAYKQAFNNGFRSALEICRKYVDLDQQIKEKDIDRPIYTDPRTTGV